MGFWSAVDPPQPVADPRATRKRRHSEPDLVENILEQQKRGGKRLSNISAPADGKELDDIARPPTGSLEMLG
ncbi:unnamed protein product, partial [Polarella glacialis]